MSKINAIRFINLSYNYNGIRVDDETFHLGGESTLLSLRNGGGKSVLVQMVIAPLVHKRYRDSKDRPFSSYFTTNKPSFILIEWKLDGDAGYVLTGMMVRKNQEIKEDQSQSDLDIIQFIHEYKNPNQYDINNIPFINTTEENKKLMNYSNCKELLENAKLDRNYKFYPYDMNNRNSSRSYFDKLEEYKIYSKEWESIVKKVNIKESGLSELFVNAKDETGLLEDWFLPAIEDKLNKGKNRIDEFRNILGSFIKQYKDNKSKIDQKNIIILFKEETKTILEIADSLKNKIDEKAYLENIIANLIISLKDIRNQFELQKTNLLDKEKLLDEEIKEIQYEELSFEIYTLEDKKVGFLEALEGVKGSISKYEEELSKLIKNRNIQSCAKIYRLYKDASRDVQLLENKLELKKEKNQDRAPEREALGYTLKVYYENEKYNLETSIKLLEDEILSNKQQQEELEILLHKQETEEKETISWLSKIKTKIESYSELETNFNVLYKDNLTRNILGQYEDGVLDLKKKDMDDLVERMVIELVRLKKTVQDNKQKLQTVKRRIQENGREHATTIEEMHGIERKILDYNREIEERKIIIRYIGLSEDKLFNKGEILSLFEKKMVEIQSTIKVAEREVERLEDNYNKLKSGKVLELPKDFEEELKSSGIHYTYGMEWLNKNNKSTEENKLLVEKNPFIPYSLIMSERELENLKSLNLNLYTSFPIPIIKREDIDLEFNENKSSIYITSKVNFYVLFNDNLLDEEELKNILHIKEEEISNSKAILRTRLEEHVLYNEKFNIIKYQLVTEKNYSEIQKQLTIKEKLREELENNSKELINDDNDLTKMQEENLDYIKRSESEIGELKRKQEALGRLYEKYDEYLEQRIEKTAIDIKTTQIRAEIIYTNDKIKSLHENYNGALDSKRDLDGNLKLIDEKVQLYTIYATREVIQRDIEDIEARYKALTNEITSELRDIEEDLKNARGRFKVQEEDLIRTSKTLKVLEDEYIKVVFDNFTLEIIIQDMDRKKYELNDLNSNKEKLSIDIAVLDSEISSSYKKLYDNLGKVKLIGRELIVLKEFNKRIMLKRDDFGKLKISLNNIVIRLGDYDSNISNLAEYDDFLLTEPVVLDYDLSTLDRGGLDRYRGELLRDYRLINETQTDLSSELSRDLDKIIRNKAFKDDFFNKPLNTLFSLIKDPNEFIEQLMTTIRAYDDLMAKLEVDIAFIEKEKDRVIEMLLEYIRDIHRNMEKIDKNSTIKVKDRSIKMLRIILPEWDAEEYIYSTKLRDMVENLTQSGLNRLENNENIEELISPFITTKNLYNTAVGINNVEIKLYKIEAERQYSITWADVAKNSGGEGFLSAFVVLSSLLSFMRRDETDIFAELEEGKVLVMDNPFAQTNSSHLLRPLMDIAKKSNTQLICLTGLGGESIYNCFDNIYILNLISSNLRKGTQYLTSEHTKGEDFEAMISSQIKTEDMEQLGFLF